MLFKCLQASAALNLDSYSDFDHFHESERYAHAQSIPLSTKNFRVLRASLDFPCSTLSLVRTFPRIIKGYDFSNRLLIVVPMDRISSTRLNGEPVGQSLVLLAGHTDCTVVEPEGRLVAILSIRPEMLDPRWQTAADGHMLLRLPPVQLLRLQHLIASTLKFAAAAPDATLATDVLSTMQESIFLGFDEAVRAGAFHDGSNQGAVARYRMIVEQVNELLSRNPLEATNEKLADEIGISVRTLQTATQSVYGLPLHRYSRLKRLWSVRRQLQTGAAGLTVKASALAHGFRHISQFTHAYCESFGELPSATLAQARLGKCSSDGLQGRRHRLTELAV